MAINKPPVRRLELEFLPSNISGYDSIIKINVVKEPGFVGDLEFIEIDKFIVDADDSDAIKASEQIMQYIGDGVYISDSTFIGGIEIVEIAKDKSNLKITKIKLKDFKYLLDFSVDPTDLILYSLTYTYLGVEYKTPITISYRPLIPKQLYKGFIRPCITMNNYRFRGPNESDKYDQFSQEVYSDISYLNVVKSEITTDININTEIMDEMTAALYNITDRAAYYQKHILGA